MEDTTHAESAGARTTLQEDAGRAIGPAPASGTRARNRFATEQPAVRPLDPFDGPPERDQSRLEHGTAGLSEFRPAPPPRPASGSHLLVGIVAGVLGAAVTLAALAIGGVLDRPETVIQQVQGSAAPPAQIVVQGNASTQAAGVARKVVPSIVAIEVGTTSDAGGFDAFASGSGVVLSAEGHIVTNAHVIADGDTVQVVLQDGSIYQADVIGVDTFTDLAVLEIEGAPLTPIELGASSGLAIGDMTVAVGNPLGLPGGASVTVGVVSAFDREVQIGNGPDQTLFGMLQTDAPITRGSSGGALVDELGRLIGITTAIGVTDAGAEGIGFAIPVELMVRVTGDIIETGTVHHTFLGVQLTDTYEQVGTAQVPSGAAITGFAAPSGALRAGLEEGDRAILINDIPIRTKEDIINELRNFRVGDTVVLQVVRDGETLSFDVVLGERPTEN